MDNTESTGSATTGPATFAEAFAGDASSASTPSETASADSASAGATAPPADSASPEGLPQQGEPPRERWDAILANARTKATEETAAQYAWAKDLEWAQRLQPEQRGHLTELATLIQRTQGNPLALLQELSKEIAVHPEYGPQLRSLAARQLAQGRGQQQQGSAEPEMVRVQLEDGSTVVVPRDLPAWQAWNRQQVLSEVEQKLAPRLQTVEQIERERKVFQEQQKADQFATGFLGNLSKRPHFAEGKNAVREKLAATKLESDHPAEVKAAAYEAYLDYLEAKVLPSLSATAQSQLLDTLQTKAAASTSVNPGAASSAAKSYDSFAKLPADMWR